MNIETKHILKLAIFMLIGMAFSIGGCKKEFVNLPSTNAEIESFSIPLTNDTESKVAIDQENLTLYWSEEYWGTLPDSIAPIIIVSANSTITPASGIKVALTDGMTYSVTAADGTTVTYTLKLVNNQANPVFTKEVEQTLYRGFSTAGINLNSSLANILWDVSKTRLYLIDPTGVEFRMPITFINTTSVSSSAVPYSGALQSDTQYKVKIVSGYRSIESSKAIFTTKSEGNVEQVPQLFNLEMPVSIKRGETMVLKGRNLDVHLFNFIRLDFSVQNLEIISISSNEITVKVPNDYPMGSSASILFSISVTGQSGKIYRNQISTAGTEITVKE